MARTRLNLYHDTSCVVHCARVAGPGVGIMDGSEEALAVAKLHATPLLVHLRHFPGTQLLLIADVFP